MTHINNNQGYHAANLPSFGGKKEPKPEVTHTAPECECGCGGSSELRGLDAASTYNRSLVQSAKPTEAVGKKGEKYKFDEQKVRDDVQELQKRAAIADAIARDIAAENGGNYEEAAKFASILAAHMNN